VNGYSMGCGHGLLFRTDRDGNPLWTREYANGDYVILEAGLMTPDGGFAACGVAPEDSSHPVNDFFVVHVRDSGRAAIVGHGGAAPDRSLGLQIRSSRASLGRAAEVDFYVPQQGPAALSVFDLSGRRLEMVSGWFGVGWHRAVLPKSLPSGVYLARLESRGGAVTERLLLLRMQ